MANKKSDVSVLVRGLGMGMAFLQALTEEIVAAGGFEEMIHFLTKEHARPTCKKLAEMIVSSDWKIPRSLMERLAIEHSVKTSGHDIEHMEHDKKYWWDGVLSGEDCGLDIPVLHFGSAEDHGSAKGVSPLPKEIVDQIAGKPATYPMLVAWKDELHVVVGIDDGIAEGKVVSESEINNIDIAPAKYFNLEQ